MGTSPATVAMRFAIILIVLVGLGGILFATQPTNVEQIEFIVPFVGTKILGYKLWTVLGAWVLGLALGYLAAVPGAFSAKRRAAKLEKQVAAVGTKATAVGAKAGEVAADARAAAASAVSPTSRAKANEAAEDASETQRLADEVARRTATIKRDA